MSAMHCDEVRARIDLYAAGECDPPTHAAVAGHLAGCPACAGELDEARRLIGLLDLRAAQPAALARLQARIAAEGRRRRRPARLRALTRRLGSLAALLLLTFGLTLGLDRGPLTQPVLASTVRLSVELRPAPSRGVPEAVRGFAKAELPRASKQVALAEADRGSKPPPAVSHVKLGGTPQALRQGLAEGRRTGNLPPPPRVDLAVRLRNDGPGKLRVQVGGPEFVLLLALRGPGAVTVPAAGPVLPPRAEPADPLRPGEELTLRWDRLVSWLGESVRYSYWTEPGVYRLTVHVRARAFREAPGGRERAEVLALTSPTLEVKVEPGKR
jgi:hypothetical protein